MISLHFQVAVPLRYFITINREIEGPKYKLIAKQGAKINYGDIYMNDVLDNWSSHRTQLSWR